MMLALLHAGWAQAGPLDLPSTPTATLNVTVDGAPLTVINYRVVYVANPVPVKSATPPNPTYDFQTMNIYVPSNATENSPIILQDNNSGWNGGKVGTSVTDGTAYTTAGSNPNKTALALKAGYVIANVGCRSRSTANAQDINNNYIAHSPAQVVDTKAAIRYLRYNDGVMPGNANRIIITGTSGGGALGVAIAASGNSPDYYPYLYAIGAAGVTYNAQSSTYSSTIDDDVFGTVLYCAITELDHMDAAYDWLYGQTRKELGTYSAAQIAASDFLAADYATYFNGLGLKDENGHLLTADNFGAHIKAIVEKEIEEALVEVGPAQMAADIAAGTYQDSTWFSIDAGGKATVDLDKYLYFVAKKTQP